MTFDNANYTIKNKLQRLALLLLTAGTIVAIEMLENLDTKFSFSRHYISITLFIMYICYNIYRIKREYNFIFFSTDVGKLTIRFYQIITFLKKCKTFEFPLAEFYKYEIQKKGLKKNLIIFRKMENKITKYPPICVNSLKKKELEQIITVLNNIKLY